MSREEERTGAARIPSLDGLRALSIVLVVLSHAIPALPSTVELPTALEPLLHNGHLGVSIFLVISGYLITLLLLREWAASGGIHLRNFYARRFLRIFPPFYCYLAVVFALSAIGVFYVPSRLFLKAGLYLWNYNLEKGNWFLNHFWTLSLEEQFYLFWPVTLILARPRGAAKVALILICLSPMIRVLTYALWPAARGNTGMMFHTAADKLMFGCLAALWQDSARFQSQLKLLDRWQVQAGLAVFLFVLSPHLTRAFGGAYVLPLGITLEGVAITLLLLWLVRHPATLVGKWFNHPAAIHVGVISYSLYIWQQLFLAPALMSATSLGGWLLRILACFAAAEFSYWGIERPCLSLKRFFKRPADRAVTAVPSADGEYCVGGRAGIFAAQGQV